MTAADPPDLMAALRDSVQRAKDDRLAKQATADLPAAGQSMPPERFRKKPVEIEAMQLTRENGPKLWEWADSKPLYGPTGEVEGLRIYTLEGDMRADFGDWIIRGVKGEFYPCKPDIFEATYDPVAPEPSGVVGEAAMNEENAMESDVQVLARMGTNGQAWAQEWCRTAREILSREGMGPEAIAASPAPVSIALDALIDEGWMIGWFANAIEAGRSAPGPVGEAVPESVNEAFPRTDAEKLAWISGEVVPRQEGVECSCPTGPNFEGPQADCDVHGQPSVAARQGYVQGYEDGCRSQPAASLPPEPGSDDDDLLSFLLACIQAAKEGREDDATAHLQSLRERGLLLSRRAVAAEAERDRLRAGIENLIQDGGELMVLAFDDPLPNQPVRCVAVTDLVALLAGVES